MGMDDIFFIATFVIFLTAMFARIMYKLKTLGKVQIMKVGDFYAVRQYAGTNSFDYIRYEDLLDAKWRWIYGSGPKASQFPMTMPYEEANRIADLAHVKYLEYQEGKKRDKEKEKEKQEEKRKNKPVLIRTIPNKADNDALRNEAKTIHRLP
jgi:hypothetical protein